MTILEVRCMIGFHHWVYLIHFRRICRNCRKVQVLRNLEYHDEERE